MIRILKEIITFSGKKKKLFTKAMIVSFIGAVFGALQFLALMMTLDIIVGGKEAHILPVFAVMLISMLGRQACFYYATNAETETGYFMAAEKRVHIGDRLRYIPMGFFNDNSLGNITAVVTTTLSDVENNASRCLVIVIGGFFKYSGFLSGAVCDRCASWSDRYYWYSGLPCSNRMLHGSNRKNRPWKTAGAGRTGKICSGICAGHERGKILWSGKR